MATSRTGTAVHKRMRRIVIAEAKARGLTHCPPCGNELDYTDGKAPHGAQADEIVAYAHSGVTSTDPNDWQVLCAKCNQRKGKGFTRSDAPNVDPWPQSRPW